MPDNFHAYRDNLAPGCTDAQIEDYYGGDDGVGDEDREEQINNEQQEKDKVNGTDSD